MESKNELENKIEEEKKNNELRLNKLKIDLDRQKNNNKIYYTNKKVNILNILEQLKDEIDSEKFNLDNNSKSERLWNKVTIENQRTREIMGNINKKLESFQK